MLSIVYFSQRQIEFMKYQESNRLKQLPIPHSKSGSQSPCTSNRGNSPHSSTPGSFVPNARRSVRMINYLNVGPLPPHSALGSASWQVGWPFGHIEFGDSAFRTKGLFRWHPISHLWIGISALLILTRKRLPVA